jgi:hypothetical protein
MIRPRFPAAKHAPRPVDAARLALLAGCAWIALALARHAFAPDAGVSMPSALLGGVVAFAATFAIVLAEHAWSHALARREARPRRAVSAERLAFDGSVPAPDGERPGLTGPRSDRPPRRDRPRA